MFNADFHQSAGSRDENECVNNMFIYNNKLTERFYHDFCECPELRTH